MKKNSKYLVLAIVLPLLTAAVWLIWALSKPDLRKQILDFASSMTEKRLLTQKTRRSHNPFARHYSFH